MEHKHLFDTEFVCDTEEVFETEFICENEEVFDSEFTSVVFGNAEEYTGSYEVVPSAKEQILETAQKVLTKNVTVKEIPYREVPIVGGTGIAVIIG